MSSIKQTLKRALPKGWREVIHAAVSARNRIPDYRGYQQHLRGKRGLEVGGPSTVFRTVLPLYQVVGELDGANFGNRTVWEGEIQGGATFNFIGARKGWQHILEASDLSAIQDAQYDFVLSSNCLEHVANPLNALREWRRVIRPGGFLVLVLPKKDVNFDHRRSTTRFEHLIEDYERGVGEDDLTHLEEILQMHDLSRDPPAGSPEQFRARSLKNAENRTLHHHVFDLPLMAQMLEFVGFGVLKSHTSANDYFMLGEKVEVSRA